MSYPPLYGRCSRKTDDSVALLAPHAALRRNVRNGVAQRTSAATLRPQRLYAEALGSKRRPGAVFLDKNSVKFVFVTKIVISAPKKLNICILSFAM